MSLKRENKDAEEDFEYDEDSDMDTPDDYYDDFQDFCHVKNLNGQLEEECKPNPHKVPKLDSSNNALGGTKVLRLLQEPSVWVKNEVRSVKSTQVLSNPTDQGDFVKVEDVENRPAVVCVGKSEALSKNNVDQDRCFPDDSAFTDLNSSLNNTKHSKLFSFPLRKIKAKICDSYDASKPSWFDKVPDEVILRILSFLHKPCLIRCGLTCKNFLRLATDESLWKRIDLGGQSLPAGAIGQVFSRGVVVMRLTRATLTSPPFRNQFGATFSLPSLCKLQYLDLSMALVDVKILEEILKPCTHLKKLALENCEVSEKVCLLISENSSLEVLHLGMTTGLNHLGLIAILGRCSNLVELNLAWTGLSESTFDVICDRFQPNLLKLDLSGNRNTLFSKHIADIVMCCKNLRELDISDCSSLTGEAIDYILDHLTNLEVLSASRCYKVKPTDYAKFRHTSLRYLNIFGLFDRDEERDALSCRIPRVDINKHMFSTIARPTCGIRRSSIWNLRVRDV